MPENNKKVIKIGNLGIFGVIRQAEVDDQLIPDGAVVDAVNVNFDRKGAVQMRPRLADFDSTVSGLASSAVITASFVYSSIEVNPVETPILFINPYTSAGAVNSYMYRSGSWGVFGPNFGQPIQRCVIFNNSLIMVNSTFMYVWNGGGTWITTGGSINPQDSPGSAKLIEIYKSRVYIAASSVAYNRLYYSSVISSTGAISWDTGSDWVDINPSDGERITALKRYSIELLVFKPNFMYRFKTSGVEADALVKIGSRCQESIIEGKNGLYFRHDTGFYRYTGGYPTEISRPISDISDAIGQRDTFAWKDNDHIYWSVGGYSLYGFDSGTLTMGKDTINNTVIRYTESSDVWTVYSYPKAITSVINFENKLIGVAKPQNIYYINGENETTAKESSVPYLMTTKWYDFGGIEDQKVIKRMVAACEKAQGGKILYQTNEEDKWNDLGQLRAYMTDFNQLNIKFHRIRFKLRGISSSEPFVFQSLSLTDYENEGPIV
jgi:hypothetical protein